MAIVLHIELADTGSGQRIQVKNTGSQVLYHDSDIHEADEWVELTVRVLESVPTGRQLVSALYDLLGSEIE